MQGFLDSQLASILPLNYTSIHFDCLLYLQGALSLAELGTIVPESGAEYAYLLKAFGPLPAFLFAWMFIILLRPASVAIMALTCAKYIIVPAFEGSCDVDVESKEKVLAAVCICEWEGRACGW